MKEVNNILFATDFSETSKNAEAMAQQLRDRLGATLHLVHIFDAKAFEIPAPYYFMPGADSWIDERIEGLRNKGQAALKEYGEKIGNCQLHFIEGKPGSELVQLAKDKNVDMIVMGTHGHTGLDRVLMGSVAEYVMRHTDIPVLTVKP